MSLRPLTAEEAPDAAHRSAVAMGGSADEPAVERWRGLIDQGLVWGLERDGQVMGHCRLLPTERWFGGRRVPCLDISAVAVPPEHRAQGVAREMMVGAVERGVADGYGLSLLFPATTAMYRKLGWELAGFWQRHQVDPRLVPAQGPSMRAADSETDWAAIRACQERFASELNGAALRDDARWTRLAESPYRYVLDDGGAPGRVEAYALIRQREIPGDWQHVVAVDDWAATSERGLRAVIAMIGRWSTFGSVAEFVDTVPGRWPAVIAEQDVESHGSLHWMARGLDVPTAIAARGFPTGLALAVTLRIDGGGPEGPWRLEVADGRGQLAPAGGADVRLDGRAVGPLFTGYRSARDLRLLGLLQGPDEALEMLDAAFAGSPPMVLDFF